MNTYRNNPEGPENMAASKQAEREAFALQMQHEMESEPRIFIADLGESVPLSHALDIMTDDWFVGGRECSQTCIDMANALRILSNS